ncbi:hypothetical protein BKA70DRAFT_587690 [Coprinopsis sp. MPI-PUGE-AT-0042]|nr:hypothetical protein BKA70DRAFT_587690 [Coprinopsis sp. MPI-PUGE-AT-0042]
MQPFFDTLASSSESRYSTSSYQPSSTNAHKSNASNRKSRFSSAGFPMPPPPAASILVACTGLLAKALHSVIIPNSVNGRVRATGIDMDGFWLSDDDDRQEEADEGTDGSSSCSYPHPLLLPGGHLVLTSEARVQSTLVQSPGWPRLRRGTNSSSNRLPALTKQRRIPAPLDPSAGGRSSNSRLSFPTLSARWRLLPLAISSYCLLPFTSSSRGVGADVAKFDKVCDRNWFGERGKALELAGQGQCGCGCVKLGVQGFEEMGCRVADTATESGTLNSRIRDVYRCYGPVDTNFYPQFSPAFCPLAMSPPTPKDIALVDTRGYPAAGGGQEFYDRRVQ